MDQKGGSSGFAAKWMAKWLESTGYARMKVQSVAEQSIEHLLDRKLGGVLVVAKGTPRTFRSMWVGRTEESDEHLVVNEIGHVVRARTVRRCVENENSGQTSSSSTQLLRVST